LALPGKTQTRKPGVEWNNADDLDDGRDDALELSDEEKEIAKAGEWVQKKSPSGGQVIDLLDIARPAKPKGGVSLWLYGRLYWFWLYAGIGKEFEVVQGSPRVVALPDDLLVPAVKEEDWQDICPDDVVGTRKSYSAAVRDNDGE
jgi:hypothetical protein